MYLNEIKPKTKCRIVKILGSGGIEMSKRK